MKIVTSRQLMFNKIKETVWLCYRLWFLVEIWDFHSIFTRQSTSKHVSVIRICANSACNSIRFLCGATNLQSRRYVYRRKAVWTGNGSCLSCGPCYRTVRDASSWPNYRQPIRVRKHRFNKSSSDLSSSKLPRTFSRNGTAFPYAAMVQSSRMRVGKQSLLRGLIYLTSDTYPQEARGWSALTFVRFIAK